jgi:hypothetical protein
MKGVKIRAAAGIEMRKCALLRDKADKRGNTECLSRGSHLAPVGAPE